jgi:crotonobetainyl-CoA:carnitine CoA-transferase CaiB-like acyl-CoA transferase
MGPLSGTRILDFSHGVAGPYATMILGDLGAEVLKIERPGRGDVSRFLNVSESFNRDIPASGGDYFLTVNRNKKSIALDLGSDEGRAVALDLAKQCDMVVQSFRPGVIERLGLGYDDIRAIRPDVIFGAISAYGQFGPLAHQPGMDVAVQARSGVMSITGDFGGTRPVKPGVSLADFSGGVHLAVAMLAAQVRRATTGEGDYVSVSLLDATMSMLSNFAVTVLDGGTELEPMGSGHPQLVPYQAFATSDGFIVISTGTNRLFRDLCMLLGLPELIEDERFATNPSRVTHRDTIVPILEDVLAKRTTAEWIEAMEREGIPCSPVNTMREALNDPQMAANDSFLTFDHPVYGTIHTTRTPYRFKQGLGDNTRPPQLGEQTDEVLESLLGYDETKRRALHEAGVIAGA